MLSLYLIFACGPKKDVPSTQDPQSDEALEETVVEPEIEEPPIPAFPSNVDFSAIITFADGSTKEGQVIRLERSEKFEGTEDRIWFEDEKKLRVELSTSSGDWQQTYWKDISEFNISIPRLNFNCVYSSDWSPWLYSCAVPTKSSAKTIDGKVWNVDTKYKYKMYFETEDPENPDIVSFWLNTHRTIKQDDTVVRLGDPNPENSNLYLQLQKQLQLESKTNMVTKIVITH